MTRRGFYRLGLVLPLVGFALAAALREHFGWERSRTADAGARTEWVYPDSITRGLIAYLGVTVWAWWLVDREPRAVAGRALWFAPLLFVGITSLFVALVAVTEERGVAALAEQRTLLLYRTAAHLALGYAYVAIIQWGARQIEETDA
jgi:hypothetical protein